MSRRLPRLDSRLQVVNSDGQPLRTFQQWWDKVARTLETQQDAQEATDQEQDDALVFLDEALTKARAAYERIGPGAYEFTASATMPEDCRTALVDASGGAVTLTLLPAADSLDDIVTVKTDATANAVTIDGNAAETISGAATQSTTTQWQTLNVRPVSVIGGWILI